MYEYSNLRHIGCKTSNDIYEMRYDLYRWDTKPYYKQYVVCGMYVRVCLKAFAGPQSLPNQNADVAYHRILGGFGGTC